MHPLSELTWRRLPDIPKAMWHPQSVTVDTAGTLHTETVVSYTDMTFTVNSGWNHYNINTGTVA